MSDPFADDADRAHRLGRPFARFMEKWRGMIRRHPWLDVTYKVIVTLLGTLIILAGVAMLVLPGPGWLTIFVGLAILGSEYHWARRLLGWLRKVLARIWERWRGWRAERRERKAARSAAREAANAEHMDPDH